MEGRGCRMLTPAYLPGQVELRDHIDGREEREARSRGEPCDLRLDGLINQLRDGRWSVAEQGVSPISLPRLEHAALRRPRLALSELSPMTRSALRLQ